MSQGAFRGFEWLLCAIAGLLCLLGWQAPESLALTAFILVGVIALEAAKVRFPYYGFHSAAPVFLIAAACLPEFSPSQASAIMLVVAAVRLKQMGDLVPAFMTLTAAEIGMPVPAVAMLFLLLSAIYPMVRSKFFPKLPGKLVYRSWPFHVIGAACLALVDFVNQPEVLAFQFFILLGASGLIRSHRGMNLDTAQEQEARRLQGERMKEYLLLIDTMAYSLHDEAIPDEVLRKVCAVMTRTGQADTFALMERNGPRWRLVSQKGISKESAVKAFTECEGSLPRESRIVPLQKSWSGEEQAVIVPWQNEAALYLGRQNEPLESLSLLERLARLGAAALRTAHQKAQRDELSEYKVKLQALYDELAEAHKELEQSQSDLVQAKKLAAVGQLAAGVAHELNSPFQAISVHLDLIRHSLEDPDDVECADTIGEALERCRVIVKELLHFSRRPQTPPQPLRLRKILESASVAAGLKGVPIQCSDTLVVSGHEHELVSLFTNLLSNARDAVGKDPLQNIKVSAQATDSQLTVNVQDRGEGMPPEVKERVFDPFYTTKEVGSGTGLGLYMVYTYVTNAGGGIQIDSTPGEGTVVRVNLPVVTKL